MRAKIDDLTNKFRELIEENNKLRAKLEMIPDEFKTEM
jgi:uncharacterized coiled-coil DUF342 family protein